MTWTTEAPTRPGWYWLSRDGRIEVVEVTPTGFRREPALCYWSVGCGYRLSLDGLVGANWCGPLEAPP